MIPITKPSLGTMEAAAAASVIQSGWIAQGPRVAEFEEAFRRSVGAAHAVAVSSCTTGLHLALLVLGIGPGDEVVVPSLSFIATANCVRYVGATPVFADVDLETMNLTVGTVERVLTPATRAVILVHQAGTPADINALHALCDRRGIQVVEDAACAIGSTYRGAPIGGHSDLVVFSFHPRKVITTGEGGMIVTSRADWAERLRRLREHGMSASAASRHESQTPVIEEYVETGFNYRMTDIQAAIGYVQLGRLDSLVARRRELAARYQQLLRPLYETPMAGDPPYGTTNYQSFWLLLPDEIPLSRLDLMRVLAERGVATRRGIMAAHLEPAYAGTAHVELPNTERLSLHSILLPLYPDMAESAQDLVVNALAEAVAPAWS